MCVHMKLLGQLFARPFLTLKFSESNFKEIIIFSKQCPHFFFSFEKSLLNLLQCYFCLMFWCFGHEACEILAP